jgi:hypothetical protein
MARGKRYSRILSAAKYYSSIDNYIKYITDSTKRGNRVGTGDPRPASKKLYILPFNIDLATGQVTIASGSEQAFTTYSAALGTHTTGTAPADEDNILKLGDFTAARVIITTGRSNNGVAKTSTVTGQKYLSYGGKSTSLPFGKKTDTETQAAAFAEIKTAILGVTAGAIVTLKPEVF